MATPSFPLFKLPLVVLRNVFSQFHLTDLAQLSICSTRTRQFTQSMIQARDTEKLSMIIGAEIYIEIENVFQKFTCQAFALDLGDRHLSNMKVENLLVPHATTIYPPDNILTFWEDRIFGLKMMTQYFTRLFNIPISTVKMMPIDHDPNDIIDWVMNRQPFLNCCVFDWNQLTDEQLTHFLDNCRVTGMLGIVGQPNENFHHPITPTMNCFITEHGSWFRLNNLLNLNSVFTYIRESIFTSRDLNLFLKNWLDGGGNRIRFFQCQMEDLDMEEITEDIDGEVIPILRARRFLGHFDQWIQFFGGFDITREDGTIGTVFNYSREVTGIESSYLIFALGADNGLN